MIIQYHCACGNFISVFQRGREVITTGRMLCQECYAEGFRPVEEERIPTEAELKELHKNDVVDKFDVEDRAT